MGQSTTQRTLALVAVATAEAQAPCQDCGGHQGVDASQSSALPGSLQISSHDLRISCALRRLIESKSMRSRMHCALSGACYHWDTYVKCHGSMHRGITSTTHGEMAGNACLILAISHGGIITSRSGSHGQNSTAYTKPDAATAVKGRIGLQFA